MTAATRKHLKQIDYLDDGSRFKLVIAGRRGGKTSGFGEDGMERIFRCPPKGEIFYIGPTNQQTMELFWDNLQERLDQLGWEYYPRSSKQCIELSRGRKVYVIGAEKIRRIRGHKVFHAYLDELAYFNTSLKEVWRAVRPALSDLEGGASAGTTPDGKGTEAYEFYLSALKSGFWKVFSWMTRDNPAIREEEIEAASREMDPKSFKQEYEATWESFEGLAYYCFDESLHIKKCSEFDFNYPISMAMDFNVNPTSLLLVQKPASHAFFRKEYSLKNSSTVKTVQNFCEDFLPHKDKVRMEIYGDATGSNRKSTTGYSDYYYVQEVLKHYGFNFQMKVPSENPSIIDRVAYANAWLKNVKGESRVTIDPSCNDLIHDLSSQPLEGRFPSDKGNIGHKGDAFGYYIHYQQLSGQARPTRTVEL